MYHIIIMPQNRIRIVDVADTAARDAQIARINELQDCPLLA